MSDKLPDIIDLPPLPLPLLEDEDEEELLLFDGGINWRGVFDGCDGLGLGGRPESNEFPSQ